MINYFSILIKIHTIFTQKFKYSSKTFIIFLEVCMNFCKISYTNTVKLKKKKKTINRAKPTCLGEK